MATNIFVRVLPALVLASAPAQAQPTGTLESSAACDGQTLTRLESAVERGRAAVFAEDGATVERLHDDLVEDLPCLEQVVPPSLWAQHLVNLAIVAYSAQRDWQAPLAAALATWPTVDRLVGSQHPIARWQPPSAPLGSTRAVPPGGAIYLDGRQVSYLVPLRGPHLVQVDRGGAQLHTWLVEGDGSDTAWGPALAWLAPSGLDASVGAVPPEPAEARRATPWLVAGGVVAGVGAGLGLGTWALRERGIEDPGQQGALVVGNTVGWGLALAGSGLLGVGLVKSLDLQPRLIPGPGSLLIQGSFR